MAKEKVAVYFHPEKIMKSEQEYQEDNCASKTEFIEKAVKFYIGYLRQQQEVNYLSPMTMKMPLIISKTKKSKKGKFKMINLMFTGNSSIRTTGRSIKLCQDRERYPKLIQSLSNTMAIKNPLKFLWSP